MEGVAGNARGPASGPLKRVEDEDEFENEDELVAATPRQERCRLRPQSANFPDQGTHPINRYPSPPLTVFL